MASESDIEAAAFFAHLFRATISAAARAGAEDGRPPIFHPILIGLLSRPQPDEGIPLPTPDRILLVDPVSRGVTVLRGDASVLAEILSAGSGRKGPPPASKASIEAMTKVESVDVGEECAVCLDELTLATELVDKEEAQAKAEVKEMPCRHRFHGGCIEKWLGMHGTCPVCRFCMPAEDVSPTKSGGDGGGVGAVEDFERAVWFEVSFGRGETGDQETGRGGEAEEHTSN
ncbi:hypothetical protein HPP92_002090 [Vanilla planifolia]|uniref:RING-type domain-containing protein n=1 Tax=Vanilla planifolia TaxID=51239 RepID=A0A835S3Q9_VANPL|nr:hypothetical protein HPP92_027584 [Vanilla planifolia]KAG0502018.1 hypothetical protein HPP92_002090 [Vanilla planifolia]